MCVCTGKTLLYSIAVSTFLASMSTLEKKTVQH